MAISAKEFLEQYEAVQRGDTWVPPKQHTGEPDCCEDCYYEALGAVIDKHPIVSPCAQSFLNETSTNKIYTLQP